jgi:hypothetical protein
MHRDLLLIAIVTLAGTVPQRLASEPIEVSRGHSDIP